MLAGGLFSSQFNHSSVTGTGSGLFPGISTNINIKSLFNNSATATTQPAAAPVSTSLFSGSALFNKSGNLGTGGLFSQNASIFGFDVTVPPVKKGEDDGGE